jgi:hypothetical protein
MFTIESESTRARRSVLIATQTKTAAYAMFPVGAQVEEVVHSLNLAGFEDENICVFLSPAHPIAAVVQNMKVNPSSDRSVEAGRAGVVSWLSRFGAVVIPGVGFFIGSREFLSALVPHHRRSSVDGGGELLAGLGIPLLDAARYQARVRRDATLIFVSCQGAARSQWAREILWRMRAEEVRLLGEYDEVRDRREEGPISSLAS